MGRFKKYALFVLYSFVGTAVDWVLLKISSLLSKGIIFAYMIVTFSYDEGLFDTLVRNSSAGANSGNVRPC